MPSQAGQRGKGLITREGLFKGDLEDARIRKGRCPVHESAKANAMPHPQAASLRAWAMQQHGIPADGDGRAFSSGGGQALGATLEQQPEGRGRSMAQPERRKTAWRDAKLRRDRVARIRGGDAVGPIAVGRPGKGPATPPARSQVWGSALEIQRKLAGHSRVTSSLER